MQINIIYDSSVSNAPAAFETDVNIAVQYLESLFPNPATITIDVGYGEIDGQSLGSNDLGESLANYVSESYSAVRNALIAQGAPGSSTLPTTSPLSGTVEMSTAEAKALGLMASNSSIDGWVGFSSTLPFSYGNGTTPPSNEYYFIGVVEHEITEDMGRVSLIDGQPSYYSVMDLYRWSSPGVRDTTTGGNGSTAYFSIDDGTTNLGTWNNQVSNGDLGDWYPQGPAPGGNDAFNDYSNPGVINVVSSSDITLMDALGWGAATPTTPTVTSVSESPSSGDLNAGKMVAITIGFNETVYVNGSTPTLALNDNGTATYVSGSGTSDLVFDYTVQSGQNTNNLLISSVDLNGATITDGNGNNANLTAATTIIPAGIVEIDTTPPVVTITSTGGSVSQPQVTINGTVDVADAGTTVTVLRGTTALATATVASNGTWSAAVTLAAGDNTLTASDTDAAGNTGTSNSVTFDLISTPLLASISATTPNNSTTLGAGEAVTITVVTGAPVTITGTPTLQLNDNEVAVYTGGSGTNALTFIYTVQPGDNVSDLQVTGLNLPSGASITSQTYLAGGVTGDLGLTVNAATVPATSVQQEILGLYAALYNRAADFPGYSYWVGVDGQQSDSGGVTVGNASSIAVTLNDAQLLGQEFVNSQSTFFNQTYGTLTDSQFINALYLNIGGSAGDPNGIAYWTNLLTQAEASGESTTAARAGIVGQFVHDLIDINLSTQPADLTTAQYQAALERQATIDNKIAVSLAYEIASQQPGGSILDPHTVGDSAYQAAVTALSDVTNNGTTADVAIAGIHAAVIEQSLVNIV